MRLFQAALDTPLDSPFSATLSVHGLHFTVCAFDLRPPVAIDRKVLELSAALSDENTPLAGIAHVIQ